MRMFPTPVPPLAVKDNAPNPVVLISTPPLPVPALLISIAPFAVTFDAVIRVPLPVVLPPVIVKLPVEVTI